jgi:hypothetical protein
MNIIFVFVFDSALTIVWVLASFGWVFLLSLVYSCSTPSCHHPPRVVCA